MHDTLPATALQLRSLLKRSGELELSLASVPVVASGADDVVVRIGGSPINPSDLGLLLAAADMGKAVAGGTAERPVVTAPISQAALKAFEARVDVSMPVGNEGAGTVVAAGDAPRRAGAPRQDRPRWSAARCTRSTAPCPPSNALLLPDGAHGRAGRVVVHQSADGPGHGRDDATRGPPRARPHRGGLQPRPDAAAHLHGRWRRAGQHRAQARAGRPAARHGCSARLRFELARLHCRARRRACRDRRDDRLRRDRRRQARRADPVVHGSRPQP